MRREADILSRLHHPHVVQLFDFGYLDANNSNARAVGHFESELARIAGVHDVRRLKSNPAFALGNLFGRLPLSRTPLLKALVANKDTKPKLRKEA